MRAPIAAITVLAASSALGEERPLVAVLDFDEAETELKRHELQLLADLARGTALRVVGHRYDIITRENLVDLLKAHGKTLEQCRGECETETGRLIGAEVVVSGRIVNAFGKLRVSMKVHRTDPPTLLGTEVGTAASNEQLERVVGEVTSALLGRLVQREEGPARERLDLSGAVKVRVRTRPDGAAIRLGSLDAVSPLEDYFRPGTYRLTISLPWYRTVTTDVVVRAGKPEVLLDYTLVPNFGSLLVMAEPRGAEVLLDGSPIGRGRVFVERVALGGHEVRVRAPGYVERLTLVKIEPNKTERRPVRLKPEAGVTLGTTVRTGTGQDGTDWSTATWVTATASGVVAGAGAVVWLLADQDLNAVQQGRAADMAQADALALEDSARQKRTAATVLWGAAAVGFGAAPIAGGGLVTFGAEF